MKKSIWVRPELVARIDDLEWMESGHLRHSKFTGLCDDILGHTSIQMTMRYTHPAEEQKRAAVGKFETFRLAGTVEAMEKSRQATTISATVQ